MMRHSPKVFISIVNWNKCDDTIECLESVSKLSYQNYSVIVVDNASSDRSRSVIKAKYADVIVMHNEQNLGFTGGHNIGIRYAMECGADYVWLLNNDATVEPGTLSGLIDAAEKDLSIGLISPQINYYSDPSRVQFAGSYFDWRTFEEILPVSELDDIDAKFQTGPNVNLWGTALLIRRSVVEKIGFLDERLFAYYEDLEYSIRALKGGFRNLVCGEVRIFHKNDASRDGDRPPYFYYYMSRNLYLFQSAHSRGWTRINLRRRYLAKILYRISFLVQSRNGRKEYLDAVVKGAWHGVLNVGGRMSSVPKPPYIWERILVLLGSHPLYLWSYALEGRIGLILSKLVSKFRIPSAV